jgi:hypothetical protein
MTRNGKIARLPYSIREVLNRRLRDGEQGKGLVDWLNSSQEVREVLADEFGGRAISEQNLSEWKQGGYEDWVRHQQTREWVQKLADESADLEEVAGDFSVADWLSAPLAVALGRWIHELATAANNDPKQRNSLLALTREVTELRRSDHTAERLRIDRERWETEQEEKRQKELRKLQGEITAKEALADLYAKIVEEQCAAKKKQGPMSPEDQAWYDRSMEKIAKWREHRAQVEKHHFI